MEITLSTGWVPPSQRVGPYPLKTSRLAAPWQAGNHSSKAGILLPPTFSTRESSWHSPGPSHIGCSCGGMERLTRQ